ncbi:MAG: hypothetical protein Q9194_003216, partial [Teloschistes cf. exilis]
PEVLPMQYEQRPKTPIVLAMLQPALEPGRYRTAKHRSHHSEDLGHQKKKKKAKAPARPYETPAKGFTWGGSAASRAPTRGLDTYKIEYRKLL